MKTDTIHISDDFSEVGLRTIDERRRLTLGSILKGFHRVQIFEGNQGEVLLKPLVEIPASEIWLFKNKKALASVKKGLEEAAQGKISKLNLKSL